MSGFRLYDWNDVNLLLACAREGSFAGAAQSLGLDQTTVSRRIGLMEQAVGRPLFHRRRSGATPTQAGWALVERAKIARAAMEDFEATLCGLAGAPPPTVTIGASDGLLTYTIIPVLLGSSATAQPIDSRLIRRPLPTLAFTTSLAQADIALVATAAGDVPGVQGAIRVRRVGTMHFKPVAGRPLLDGLPRAFANFDELVSQPLLDVAIYRPIRSLENWNALVDGRPTRDVTVTPNSQTMHRLLVKGKGVGILPSYSSLYDERIVAFDFAEPSLSVSLWLVAHEDKLREPAIRDLFDTLAQMFLESPWFR